MHGGKTFRYLVLAGWLISAAATLLIATIVVPEASRSQYFWYRVCWTQFLLFGFWASAGFYLVTPENRRDHVTRFGAIAPTICLVVGLYALLSFSAMVIHAFAPATSLGSRIHLVVQVVLFTAAALSVVFLSMARTGAATGLDFDKAKALPPPELHDLVALHESLLPNADEAANELKAVTKQLRETLLYSLNASGFLAESTEYQSFSREVQQLCQAMENEKEKGYAPLTETAKRLVAKAKYLSKNQARR
jgi:hypothetical protein